MNSSALHYLANHPLTPPNAETHRAAHRAPRRRKSHQGGRLGLPGRFDTDREDDYFRPMYSVRPRPSSKPPKPSLRQRAAARPEPLRLGANVRVRGNSATGVIIGNSHMIDYVRVRWDDTSEVTHCHTASLVLSR